MRCRFALILLSLVFAPTSIRAEINEDVQEVYYDVEHEEGYSLTEAINDASPIAGGHHGYTKWNLKWNYTWAWDDESCWITDVTVNLTATVTLPELYTDDEDAQDRFDRYLIALREHEEGHVDTARQAAEEVEEAILNMDARDTCEILGQDANALGNAILKRGNQRDKEYDRRTDHGRTQGARVDD